MAKYIKSRIEVDAWRFVDTDVKSDGIHTVNIAQAPLLSMILSLENPMKPKLWCEKSETWVDCPYGTYIVAEPDGRGYYPYHKGFLDVHELIADAEMNPIVSHAKRELELLGMESDAGENIIDTIKTFLSYDEDSGMSANFRIMILVSLLRMQNLTELTDNPEEWMQLDPEGTAWQSRRSSEAFSDNGGKTYYLLSEATENPDQELTFYESVKHKEETDGEEKTAEDSPENNSDGPTEGTDSPGTTEDA